MRLLEGLAELVAPTRCCGCELPGALFCSDCEQNAVASLASSTACPSCAAPFGLLVCTECWQMEFAFEAAVALGELDGPLARAVVLHKDASERRVGARFGQLLANRIQECWREWVPNVEAVTWVPPSREALARRGFDHGAGIALPLAATLGIPARALLSRSGSGRDQRRLGRRERALNSRAAFSAVEWVPRTVLLVDDVFTTGATADGAAAALLGAGAESVRVAVLARAW